METTNTITIDWIVQHVGTDIPNIDVIRNLVGDGIPRADVMRLPFL